MDGIRRILSCSRSLGVLHGGSCRVSESRGLEDRSFLAGAPEVQAVGWVDCERDSPGSNWGCRENVESFLYSHGRSAEIRYWSWSWESLAFGQADLVQVDGEHSYDSCMLDLIFAYRLSPQVVTVDDYSAIQTVRRATNDYAAEHGLGLFEVQTVNGMAVLHRDDSLEPALRALGY